MGYSDQISPLVIGLGVPKAATTWMHRQLEAHPEIAATFTKELGYWKWNYHKGGDWYIRQFNRTPQTCVHVEYTPQYLANADDVLARVSADVVDARFLLTLRNPYERAFSVYLEKRRNGEENLSFEETCEKNPIIVSDGCYTKGIETFLKYYDRDRLHIMFFDDIEKRPLEVVRGLYQFMGVDSDFVPENLTSKVNAGRGISKTDLLLKKLELTAKRMGIERRHLVRFGIGNLVDRYKLLLSKRNPKPKIGHAEINYLDTRLRHDILKLQHLIDRDLSFWLP